MKIRRSFLVAGAVVLLTAAGASAQTAMQTTSNSVSRGSQFDDISDEDLIHSLFDPVTKALNLTPAQKFTIVTIASASMNSTEPLFDQLKQW